MSNLLTYLPEFVEALRIQLEADDVRWGDTWEEYPIEGQEERTMARYTDYYAQFKNGGVPMPWLKVAGGAFICWVRELRAELIRKTIGEDI